MCVCVCVCVYVCVCGSVHICMFVQGGEGDRKAIIIIITMKPLSVYKQPIAHLLLWTGY